MTRILVFGDSIERGHWDFEGGWVQRLQQDLDEYSWENDQEYSVYNLGVSGDTSEDILDRMKQEMMVRENSEDMVVLLKVSGLNDSQVNLEDGKNTVYPDKYRQNLSDIIDLAQKYTETAVMIGGTPINPSRLDPIPWKQTHAYRGEELAKYRERRVEMSENRRIDLMEIRPYVDENEWRESKLKDGLHPNMVGHKQIYRIVKDGLKERNIIPEDA